MAYPILYNKIICGIESPRMLGSLLAAYVICTVVVISCCIISVLPSLIHFLHSWKPKWFCYWFNYCNRNI